MGKPLCQDARPGQNSVEKTWHSDCSLNIYARFTVWTCTNTMQFQAWYSLILHFYSPSCPCHHSSTPVGSVWLSQKSVCVCVWLCMWVCVCEGEKMHASCHLSIHLYPYVCVCVCVAVYVGVCVCEGEKMRASCHLSIHLYPYVCVCVWLCMWVCVCV